MTENVQPNGSDLAPDLQPVDALREAGRWQEAADAARKIAQATPNRADAWALLALVLPQLKKMDEADQAAQQSLALAPQNPVALRALAVIRLRQQKTDEAARLAEQALTQTSDCPLALMVMAAVRISQQRMVEADALLTRAINIQPLAEVHANRALLEMRRANLQAAIQHAEIAVSKKPFLSNVWQMLAVLYQQTGRQDAATAALEQVIRHEAGNAAVLSELGEHYRRAKRLDEALNILERAVTLSPNLASAWTNYGAALQEAKRIPEAMIAFEKALAVNPQQAEVHCNLGSLYKDAGKLEEANASYRKAVLFKPDLADAHNNLGVILKQQGKLNEAVASCQKALSIKPDFANAHDNLGIVLKDMGRLDEALIHFRRALTCLMQQPRFTPSPPKAYMNVDIAHSALLALKAGLEAEGAPFFLAYGTLLGIVRDGDLLPHDKDMDVGLPWDVPRETLMMALTEKHGFVRTDSLLHCPEKDEWNIDLVHRETGIACDLFFFRPDGEFLLSGIHQLPVPLLWRFSRFTTRPLEYLGQTWRVPDPPERFLDEIYGGNWRTPDPYFDSLISGHNRNPEALDVALCYAYNRLFDRVERAEWKKAAGYCRQILAQRPDPFIEELKQWLEPRLRTQND